MSLDDFDLVKTLAEQTVKEQRHVPLEGTVSSLLGAVVAGLAFCCAAGFVANGVDGYKDLRRKKKFQAEPWVICIAAGACAVLLGKVAYSIGSHAVDQWAKLSPERAISGIHKRVYDNYLNHVIEAQQKQFKVLEWDQAKQLIQNAQSRK